MKRESLWTAALVVFGAAILLAQEPVAGTATDPVLGAWSLNVERSTFAPGAAPPPGTVSVRQYSRRTDGFMVTLFVSITPDGDPAFLQVAWKYDGKDYPVYAPSSLADLSTVGISPGTMAYRATDAWTTEMTPRDSHGKLTFNGVRRRAVSRDGQTLIDISRGTNAQGETVESVLIFNRCKAPCFQFTP